MDTPGRKLNSLIERLAQDCARGINYRTLKEQGRIDEANNWALAHNMLTEEQLITMENRAALIRENLRSQDGRPLVNFERQRAHKPFREAKGRRSTRNPYLTGQMYLEQTYPDGYERVWGPRPKDEKQKIEVLDPERKINSMYYRKRMSKIHLEDISHVWSEFLKSVGYTQKEMRERLMRNMSEAIQRLMEAGVWGFITKGTLNAEELSAIREALNEFVIDRDWDSSELITIYPNEGAWWRDVFGVNSQEELFEVKNGVKLDSHD